MGDGSKYMIMIIYKITNKTNGRIYIGQTIRPINERIYGHIADSKRDRKERCRSKIHKSIFKHGIDNFIFEIIDTALSQDELNIKEIYFINLYRSNIDNIGYNLLSGGKQNGKHSEETKNKISLSSKAAALKAKINGKHWNEGRTISQEQKDTVSAKLKGVKCPQRGHKYTDEDKLRRSIKMKEVRKNNNWSTSKINK